MGARRDSDVAIWTIRMAPRARFVLPRAPRASNRTLYFFRGDTLVVGERRLGAHARVELRPAADVELEAGAAGAELLLLQGRPIGEPVAQYGPFVMNTRAEIEQAMRDYQRTQFGGWPWPSDGPVHAARAGASRATPTAASRKQTADAAARGAFPQPRRARNARICASRRSIRST